MPQPTLTYLITGANRGLGLEFVRQLSQKNHTVLAGVRSPARAEELQNISSAFSNVYVFQIDTADEQSVKTAVGEVERLSPGGIDILINNAAIGGSGVNSTTTPKEDFEQVLTTNVTGTLIVTNAFLPALLKRPTRKVINLGSILGSVAKASAGTKTSYRVSKAAINMLTRCYALDLRSENFTVLTLHPGWVQTDMGGMNAIVTPEKSISGMLQEIEKATAADSGSFLDYQGSSLPW